MIRTLPTAPLLNHEETAFLKVKVLITNVKSYSHIQLRSKLENNLLNILEISFSVLNMKELLLWLQYVTRTLFFQMIKEIKQKMISDQK